MVASVVALSMVLLNDFTLLGLSSYSGVKFSVISFACVIMSVGLCVYYFLHMAQKCVKKFKLLRTLKTGDAHSNLLFLLEDQMAEHLDDDQTLLYDGSEKFLQQESKTKQDVTPALEAEKIPPLPFTTKPPYTTRLLGALSGAVDTAEGSVRRDFVEARLGEMTGGGYGRGEYTEGWWGRRV